MNLFDLFAKISLDTSEYDSGIKNVEKSGSGLASKLKSGLASAGKAAAAGLGVITTAAGAVAGGLLALEQSTEEYRIAQGRLNTAFESAGYGAETAKQAYSDLYGILGDTDRATEASQLLAQLSENEEDLSKWTNIAAGVNGTFGDSLPIESLIEAANETANVGTVTGVLADALNWVGISEDEFNEKLAECSSESERNQLIMETLAGQYDEAADAFYRNNEALVESRNAQAQMDAVLAQLGQTVSNIRSQLTADFLPAISQVASAFNNMLTGTEGADQQFATAVQNLVNQGVSLLPQFLSFGTQILTSLLSGIVQSIPTLVSAVPSIISSLVTTISANLPALSSAGSDLLNMFASGIVSGIPALLVMLPDVITAIYTFLKDNLPKWTESGFELLENLAFGILDAIPDMIAKLPEVINAMAEYFTSEFPTILKKGGELLGQLIVGIIGAIPEIALQLPDVITAIVEALEAGWETIKDAGKYLLEGLWAGISDKVQWLKDKVSGVVDTIKSWFTGSDGFDEHSPSKWAKQVFRYVMEGGGQGLEAGLPGLMSEVQSVTDRVKNGMNFGTANVDFASSGLGMASAGMVNGISSAVSSDSYGGGPVTINLVLPDGTKFASWQLPYLIQAGRAAGTPIANPQVG